MISLLLTLFISLFSYCPSVNTIEEHIENNNFNVKNVAQVDDIGGFDWRFYSLNDLTSYDILTNIWNYNTSHNNALVGNTITINGTEAYIALVDGGANVHYDYTGFEILYRVCKYYISYDEDASRFKISIKFDFCTTDNNIPIFGMTFNNYRYKFSGQGYVDTEIVSNMYTGSSESINVFLNHPFLIRVSNVAPSLNLTEWWLYDVLGTGNFNSYQEAYDNGYGVGYNDATGVAYQEGYNDGYAHGSSTDATASTIFTGILDVALIPVNVFLTIFNFEVFGINIAGIVSALLTISVVVIIIRFVTGKKDD